MADGDSKKGNEILTGDDLKILRGNDDFKMVHGLTRRDFVKYSAGTVACIYLGTLTTGCGGNSSSTKTVQWTISDNVFTTVQQQVLPVPVSGS